MGTGEHLVLAARAARVPFVAVLTGATTRTVLEAYAPVALLETVNGVPALLDRGVAQPGQ